MIHHSSTDPVLIKKISLKVWTLRDEVEARVREKVSSLPEDIEDVDLSDIRSAYTKNSATTSSNNIIELKTGNDLDTSEDEMLKAMQGDSVEVEEEVKAEEALTEASDTEPPQTIESNVTDLFDNQKNSNVIELSTEMPPLSEDKIFKGKTVLAEIGMDRIYFFSNKKFTEGQSIVIKFEIPKTFIMNADVLYCRPFNLKSRVISENNFQFRVMAKFSFLKEGERALLRQFLKSVEPEVQTQTAPVESKSEKSEDSDFSELDDLI